ncbi:MAG: hypothetical protein SGPRY_001021 [Prymnesium sp.]
MDKFREVQEDLQEATGLMRENIESVVSRGEQLELLMDKSEGLTASARQFQKHSTGLRRALWWKNAKMMAMLLGSALAVRPPSCSPTSTPPHLRPARAEHSF